MSTLRGICIWARSSEISHPSQDYSLFAAGCLLISFSICIWCLWRLLLSPVISIFETIDAALPFHCLWQAIPLSLHPQNEEVPMNFLFKSLCNYHLPLPHQKCLIGKNAGAGKLVEDLYEIKVPGVGCTKHSTERFHNALFRHEFGATSSPEEAFAKRTKKWFNETDTKDCKNVR